MTNLTLGPGTIQFRPGVAAIPFRSAEVKTAPAGGPTFARIEHRDYPPLSIAFDPETTERLLAAFRAVRDGEAIE